MKNLSVYRTTIFLITVFILSCESDNNIDTTNIVVPDSYEFTRDGETTVSFSGQTTRLNQAEELYSALNSNSATE